MNKEKEKLIKNQYEELHQKFQGLRLCEDSPGQYVIRGELFFNATYNEVTIEDRYSVLITFSEDYSDTPPDVYETGGRIPPDFHQYDNRSLCLGAPVEVDRRFKADPRLIKFVETLVTEYLYGYSHLEKYGKLPFGELSHGGSGILEYYQELFNTNHIEVILRLLKIMADGKYRGHHLCPCGSEIILRKCHGPKLLRLIDNQRKERFLFDFKNIIYSLEKREMKNLNWGLFPTQFKYELNQIMHRKVETEN